MTIKTFKYFDAGIGFKDQAADNITTEGVIYKNGNFLKLYIQAAARQIVTDSQTQTLTNKTFTSPVINSPTGITKADVGLGNVDNTSDATKNAATVSLTNKTIDASLNTLSNISNASIATSAAIAYSKLAALTASRALVSDGTGVVSVSTVTSTELGLLSGKTGALVTTNDTGTVTSTMIADNSIVNVDINSAAAIARTKLASGTNNALQANNGSGVLSDITDITVGTNNFTLANTKHIELQAATDSTTTGSNASLAAFTGGAVRLTNASLVSLANIPAGANGQELVIFNRTGVAITVVDSSLASGTAANRIFTGTSATITMAKDAALILSYDSTSARWQVIGGTGGGSSELPFDTLAQQSFESAVLTDFTQTGLTLVTASNLLIKNAKAAQLISAGSTQSFKQVIPVDNEFKGKNLTLNLYTRSSATQGNVTILIFDETNATNLAASQPITLASQAISATTNTNTTLSGLSVSDVNKLKIGQTVTGSGIATGTTITAFSSSALTATLSQAASASATVTLRISDLPAKQSFTFDVPTSCISLSYTISALAETGSPESYFDDIAIKLTSTALSSTSITIPKNNDYDWVDSGLTTASAFQGFGTPSAVSIQKRRVGDSLFLRGSFTISTITSTEYRIPLPDSLLIKTGYVAASPLGDLTFNAAFGNGNNYFVGSSAAGNGYLNIYMQSNAAAYAIVNTSTPMPVAPSTLYFTSGPIPIAGWSAVETTSTTIPLTTAQLVQTPDSMLRLSGGSATGSAIWTGYTVVENTGSAFKLNSATGQVTVLLDGIYNISASGTASAGGGAQIFVNGLQYAGYGFSTATGGNLPYTVPANLKANDIISVSNSTASGAVSNAFLEVSYAGSLKQLNPSSDTKITIPTHQLRFEGASTRGAVATQIVKFDTQTITQGDAWTVVSDSNNGTYIQLKKAGTLALTGSLNLPDQTLYLTLNQTTLTAAPLASEILSSSENVASRVKTASAVIPVKIGDIVRVAASSAPNSNIQNSFILSLTETSIAANFSNVLPQWSQSDSSVRLNTANGYGSTNTKIRRFTNTVDNLGTAITYADSATLGASFTVNEDGIYHISYSDIFSTGSNLGISKNSSQLTTQVNGITVADRLDISTTSAADFSNVATWQGNLIKNDVIRPHTNGVSSGTLPDQAQFTISKVGKPNLSSVDVTSFVNMKTQDVEAIEAMTASTSWGSTNTGVFIPSITKNTNLGIIQVVSDSANGAYFKALKDCTLNISVTKTGTVTGTPAFAITRNATLLTAAAGFDGILANHTFSATSNMFLTIGTTVKLVTGDLIRVQRNDTSVTTMSSLSLTATADNNATASPTQQVSSDTMNFVFKSTAIDPAVDAIGTFNTYTYAASSNTATIAASAPTQTTSSMNVNGIQVFARAYNATSTSASPARVDIFVGKGLKSKQVDAYGALAKASMFSYDRVQINTTSEYGAGITYSEVTGILTIEGATNLLTTCVNKQLGADASFNIYSSGYFVINASKSPSLVTIPSQQTVAASYWLSASFAASTTIPINFDSIEFDTHGAATTSPTAWKFTAPSTGFYTTEVFVSGSGTAPTFNIYKNGTIYKPISFHATGSVGTGSTNIKLVKGDFIDIRPSISSTLVGGSLSTTQTRISIIKAGGY